jgi:type IV fimbrial biogenesis protein FimT
MDRPPVAVWQVRRSGGFTLIELIIAVTVLGILAGLGVPQFTDFLQNSRRAATLNELVGTLSLARSEAVRRGVMVSVCKTGDGTACVSGSGDTWQAGWLAFVNTDGDLPPVVDPGETVLRVRIDQNAPYTLKPSVGVTNAISFFSDGSVAPPGINGSFTYCDDRGALRARAVVVSAVGRVRMSRDTNADGIEEDDVGALSCP